MLMLPTSFLSNMWAVGINMSTSILLATPTSLGGYGMSLNALGYLYFAPVIAIIIGEALGHWGNDVSSGSMFVELCGSRLSSSLRSVMSESMAASSSQKLGFPRSM
jgi:hypothetical protein